MKNASRATPRTRPTRHLVGINEAAEYAGVSPNTIRKWISEGRLPAYRGGQKILRIDLSELDAMFRPIPTAGQG